MFFYLFITYGNNIFTTHYNINIITTPHANKNAFLQCKRLGCQNNIIISISNNTNNNKGMKVIIINNNDNRLQLWQTSPDICDYHVLIMRNVDG